jgi:F-type H+-transporting ATPase subunit a
MTVGHVLLKVIGGFVIALGVGGIIPFAFLIPLTMLELFIAVLQAYIFAILSCVYLHDALHLH